MEAQRSNTSKIHESKMGTSEDLGEEKTHTCQQPRKSLWSLIGYGGTLPQEIYISAEGGDLIAVQRYIQDGGDVNACNHYGKTLLMAAASKCHIDVARWLLLQESMCLNISSDAWNFGGADVNNVSALFLAIRFCPTELVQDIITANLPCVVSVSHKDSEGYTVLYRAIEWQKYRTAVCLLQHHRFTQEDQNQALRLLVLQGHSLRSAVESNNWSVTCCLLQLRHTHSQDDIQYTLMQAAATGTMLLTMPPFT
ncbi:unnamed protein product [Meganyctiphanes norvegica]|uniref:Uncharacterized protein n=1 Tax=Meganyctiphanes norvegica TaxID=48144 RepID=A0AAV2PY85_MEGNR